MASNDLGDQVFGWPPAGRITYLSHEGWVGHFFTNLINHSKLKASVALETPYQFDWRSGIHFYDDEELQRTFAMHRDAIVHTRELPLSNMLSDLGVAEHYPHVDRRSMLNWDDSDWCNRDAFGFSCIVHVVESIPYPMAGMVFEALRGLHGTRGRRFR